MASGCTNRGKAYFLGQFFRNDTEPANLYVRLCTSATAPTADTNTASELTEIAAGNGYTAGGFQLSRDAVDFDTLTEDDTLDRARVLVKDVSWTASGGFIPASGSKARYAVLTDDNPVDGSRAVLGWWDLEADRRVSDGQAITLQDLQIEFASEWVSVQPPTGWTWSLPFTIQRSGRTFRVDPSFNLQTYAGISVSKTYYVDQAIGSDSDDGLSWSTPFATLKKAYEQVDVDRVYIKPGWYFYNQVQPIPTTRNWELIGVGAGVYVTSDVRNQIGSWTPVSNHYSATVTGQTVAQVMDHSILTGYGGDTKLTLRASEAEVDTNANSWFQSGTTIYIRTSDDRAPDADLRYYSTLVHNVTADNRTVYFENLAIMRMMQVRNASVTGGTKAYFKDCALMAAQFPGCTEVILQNCTSFQAPEDGFNYDVRNGISTKAVEIDCNVSYGGIGSSDQGSTTHSACEIVRINGEYDNFSGQCVADTGTGKTWMLGSLVHDSTTEVGLYQSNPFAWLDRCTSSGNTTDLQNTTTAVTRTRDFVGGGSNIIDGRLETY
jgi:hypothetical protein